MYIRKVLKSAEIKFKNKLYYVPEEFIGKSVVVKKHDKYLDIIFKEKLIIRHTDRTSPQKYTNKGSRRARYGSIK